MKRYGKSYQTTIAFPENLGSMTMNTIGSLTQKIVLHKNLLGNEQWRAVDTIRHCEKRLPLK